MPPTVTNATGPSANNNNNHNNDKISKFSQILCLASLSVIALYILISTEDNNHFLLLSCGVIGWAISEVCRWETGPSDVDDTGAQQNAADADDTAGGTENTPMAQLPTRTDEEHNLHAALELNYSLNKAQDDADDASKQAQVDAEAARQARIKAIVNEWARRRGGAQHAAGAASPVECGNEERGLVTKNEGNMRQLHYDWAKAFPQHREQKKEHTHPDGVLASTTQVEWEKSFLQKSKQQLTGAQHGVGNAYGYMDTSNARVQARGHAQPLEGPYGLEQISRQSVLRSAQQPGPALSAPFGSGGVTASHSDTVVPQQLKVLTPTKEDLEMELALALSLEEQAPNASRIPLTWDIPEESSEQQQAGAQQAASRTRQDASSLAFAQRAGRGLAKEISNSPDSRSGEVPYGSLRRRPQVAGNIGLPQPKPATALWGAQ